MFPLVRIGAVIFVATANVCAISDAHPGGTDASGGHHDRKSGGYHYHGGGSGGAASSASRPSPRSLIATYAAQGAANREARHKRLQAAAMHRLKARTSVRETPRMETRATRSIDKSVELAADSDFLFHMKSGNPRPVYDFSDAGEFWRAVRPLNQEVNIPKVLVARIEPTKDLFERRTWLDAAGRFSTVARFLRKADPNVQLQRLDGREITVSIVTLSEVDQQHVRKIAGEASN